MKIYNQQNYQSPNFQMKIRGLDHQYFRCVPNIMKQNLLMNAEKNTIADFTVEFIPMCDQWVFLKKIKDGIGAIVDYFPSQYTPAEIVKTFTKAYIPEYRVMAKSLRKETNREEAQKLFGEHQKWI